MFEENPIKPWVVINVAFSDPRRMIRDESANNSPRRWSGRAGKRADDADFKQTGGVGRGRRYGGRGRREEGGGRRRGSLRSGWQQN